MQIAGGTRTARCFHAGFHTRAKGNNKRCNRVAFCDILPLLSHHMRKDSKSLT
jgi:hypothetical protein